MWVLHSLLWSVAILRFPSAAVADAPQTVNITLPITSPDTSITFSPFLCNSTNLSDSSSGACPGAWSLLNTTDQQVVSTSGPDPATGDIMPQMFVSFRAHDVFVRLGADSNATANMTVSTPSGLSVSVLLNSSLAEAGVVGLLDSHITQVAITYIPGAANASLSIESIFITVDDDVPPSSYLPSQSLPVSIPPLTYVPTPTSTPTTPSSRHRSVNLKLVEAFSLVLGIGVGLSCITAAVLVLWKRRQQRPDRKSSPDVR